MMDTKSESEFEFSASQSEYESSNESEEDTDVETEQVRGIGEKRKCKQSRQKYLDGQARGVYHLRKSLDDSFKDRSSPQLEGVCSPQGRI